MAEEAENPEGATKDSDKLAEVHKRALRRFDLTALPQMEVRAHALLCRRFVAIPGAMWDGEFGEQFSNSIRVEIDKVSRGLDKIIQDYRANRIVPDFRPAGGSSDQETADTLDGLFRADAYHFKSAQAWDNAFEEAAAGGFGAYRLCNDWTDPLDKDDDTQRVNPGAIIVDADQRVFFDPNCKTYDKSDARFAFVLTAVARDAFEEEHDGAASSWPENRLRPQYDWFVPDVVITAEYYEVEHRREELLIFTHRLTGEEQRWWRSEIEPDEIAEMEADGWTYAVKRRERRRVHKYLMSGAEVLEDCGFIAGSRIPIVPVYGKRYYVDGVERFRGYVSKLMDPQRVYNAKVSKLAETDALAPREKPIFAPSQMPPHVADTWARQDIDRLAYALCEPLIDEATGQMVNNGGPLGYIKPPDVPQVTAALIQLTAGDLSDETDDSADTVMANTSAEAMDIAATRKDAKSGIYLDNFRLSTQCGGEIYLEMGRDVYVEPGRKVEVMSEDGDDGIATLQEPFTDGQGVFRLRNDFTSGKFKVIADVTEATATRRDKTVKSMLATAQVAQAAQDLELARVAVLTAVMNQEGEGTTSMQEYARRKLVEIGVEQPNEEEKAAMAEAAGQPDPMQQQAEATSAALMAQAQKDMAQASESESKIRLNEARAVETLAKAGQAAQPPAPTVSVPRARSSSLDMAA